MLFILVHQLDTETALGANIRGKFEDCITHLFSLSLFLNVQMEHLKIFSLPINF